jgi:hypothetical protein
VTFSLAESNAQVSSPDDIQDTPVIVDTGEATEGGRGTMFQITHAYGPVRKCTASSRSNNLMRYFVRSERRGSQRFLRPASWLGVLILSISFVAAGGNAASRANQPIAPTAMTTPIISSKFAVAQSPTNNSALSQRIWK